MRSWRACNACRPRWAPDCCGAKAPWYSNAVRVLSPPSVGLLFRERVRPAQLDEVGPGDDPEALEAPVSLLEEDHFLPAARAYGLHQTPSRGELILERPGYGRERRRDQDGIVGGVL